MHGSYEAIEAGSIAEALTDLTGEAAQVFDLIGDKDVAELIRNGKFWKYLENWVMVEKFLVGCSFQVNILPKKFF